MAIAPGSRLGPYEIVSALGAGGMGEVYRARDTKLDRDVALKILPESFAADPDRLMRFEREARALAALSHPNIAAIYSIEDQVGIRALVMELVEGEDLSALIGGLETQAALRIALQIAEALEAAHEQGIVHRDLKPANIKVKADGTVKVLDFGLAKALDPNGGRSFSSGGAAGSKDPASIGDAATMTSPALTQMGVILGTAAYMSPEQARGLPVDKRADIWAFGVVLFEMLTGHRVFEGPTVSDTLAAVLRADIDLSALPSATPPAIRRLLARCLDRDPKIRLRDIGEARVVLTSPLAPAAAAPAPTSPPVAWWQRPLAIAGLSIATLTAGAFGAGLLAPGGSTAPVIASRFEVLADATSPEWSDDGRRLAWIDRSAVQGTPERIIVRRIDEFQARTLALDDGVRRSLAFSPDGQWLAYTHAPLNSQVSVTEIRKVPVTGGPSELIAKVAPGSGAVMLWHGERIYLGRQRELLEVPAAGGALRSVLTLPEGESFFGNMQVINGGRDLLFVGAGANALWTVPLSGGEPRRVLDNVTTFRVTSTGHLLYTHTSETHLMGRRFQEGTVEPLGDPVPLVELTFRGLDAFAVSSNGMLTYDVSERGRQEPVWVDRATGRVVPVHASLPSSYSYLLSPDGQYLLFQQRGTTSAEPSPLRVWDITRERDFQVTDNAGRFLVAARTQTLFFERDVTANSPQRRLFRVEFPWTEAPRQVAEWTDRFLLGVLPDGRRLVVSMRQPRGYAVVNADGSGDPVPIERDAMPSPDGRWMAYSTRSLPQMELWVRPEPAVPNMRWPLVGAATFGYFWSRDGREFIYPDEKRQYHSVTVRGVRPDAPFELGRPVALKVPAGVDLLALTPDGRRFFGIRDHEGAPPRLAIVEHFFEELRAKVPVK